MLKEYYDYIMNVFNKMFLEEVSGGRFYLDFPNEKTAKRYFQNFETRGDFTVFKYKNPYSGSDYETIMLKRGGHKVLFVLEDAKNVTVDFLVTLRNEVSNQKGNFQNTSIIFFTYSDLDSIKGGSINLTAKGSPFNIYKLLDNIKLLMKTSLLNDVDKVFVESFIEQNNNSDYNQLTNFTDLEDIIGLVYKEKLDYQDFQIMGCFRDTQIDELLIKKLKAPKTKKNKIQNEIDEKLKENKEVYSKIVKLKELGNPDEALEEAFTKEGKSKLVKDDWVKEDFKIISRYSEKAQNSKKNEMYYDDIKIIPSEMSSNIWTRVNGLSTVGRRTINIIVFSDSEHEVVEIKVPFSDMLKSEFLSSNNNRIKVRTSGKSIVIVVDLADGKKQQTSVSYKMGEGNKSFKVNLLYLDWKPSFLKRYKNIYKVSAKGSLIIEGEIDGVFTVGDDIDEYQFNDYYFENVTSPEVIIDKGGKIVFPSGVFDDRGKMNFKIIHNNLSLDLQIKDEKSKIIPINEIDLWQKKRIVKESFEANEDFSKVSINNTTYTTQIDSRSFLMFEKEIRDNNYLSAVIREEKLYNRHIEIEEKLKCAYLKVLEYYRNNDTVPSLAVITSELKGLMQNYIEIYKDSIQLIKENEFMSLEQKNLINLGLIEGYETFYLSPYSPIVMAYYLNISEEAQDEIIDTKLLQRLNAGYLLPYVELNGRIYRPIGHEKLKDWQKFVPNNQFSIGEVNAYLAKLVEEKITQFSSYYPYLFNYSRKTSFLINIVDIIDDKEVLKGVVLYLKKLISKNGLENLKEIELTLYNNTPNKISAFDLFSNAENIEKANEIIDVDYKINKRNLEEIDVLEAIQSAISYTKRNSTGDIGYAHITFYKMHSSGTISLIESEKLEESLNFKGLIGNISYSNQNDNDYRSGYGISKNVSEDSFPALINSINNYLSNLHDEGDSSYNSNKVLSEKISVTDENQLQKMYVASNWVTFIEPLSDMDYFQRKSQNLVVVHYSDQLSSTNHYDAITVTDKSKQYQSILEEFLNSHNIKVDKSAIQQTIKMFNTFNGEWLLRIIQDKGQDAREKLSLISAIKHSMVELTKKFSDIQWVPISMEEIIRISGAAGLKQKDSLFAKVSKEYNGPVSDDLLLIGLEKSDVLRMHFIPVEVKIGNNDSDVIKKAVHQVKALNMRLRNALIDESKKFQSEYLRLFFMQLFYNNTQKIISNDVWPERRENYTITELHKAKLMNDDFELVFGEYFEGIIISYKKDNSFDGVHMHSDNKVMELSYSEKTGYNTISQSIEDVWNGVEVDVFRSKHTGKIQALLKGHQGGQLSDANNIKKNKEYTFRDANSFSDDAVEKLTNINVLDNINVDNSTNHNYSEPNQQILFGVDNIDNKICWPYWHPKLNNRHLLIGGKSGTGKTYFIQSLLKQMSAKKLSTLVIDYSNSFSLSQLDSDFLENITDNIHEIAVKKNKLPVNPFKRGDSDYFDVAQRVSHTISAIYPTMGDQQTSALIEAIMSAFNKIGDDITFRDVFKELDDSENSAAAKISSKLIRLKYGDPFSYDNTQSWEDIFDDSGEITVIQLDGFDIETKQMLTEFMLWDLWNYSQKNTAEKPLPVILDEAQNLDFSSKGPVEKILREGRKFGWSTLLATQSFSNFKKPELAVLDNVATKVYFQPADSEITLIAKMVASRDNIDQMERYLRGLQKGHCVASGQFLLDDNTLSSTTQVQLKVPRIKK